MLEIDLAYNLQMVDRRDCGSRALIADQSEGEGRSGDLSSGDAEQSK
jgi:hypothetical protein